MPRPTSASWRGSAATGASRDVLVARRRRPHHGGRRRCTDRAGRCRPAAGSDAPGLRQRPQPRLPPCPARAHAPRHGIVLDVAPADVRGRRARSTRTRYLRLARATYAEMALAGISAVGEFHYLHHGPGGTPYADPNAMGEALIAAAGEAGVRLTLLDTCYLRGGIGVEPDADAAPLRRRRRRRRGRRGRRPWPTAPGVRVGAAVHSVRAVDPAAIGGRRGVGRRARRAAARPRLGATGRERAVRRAPTGARRPSCSPTAARSASGSRPSTPPTSRTPTSAARRRAAAGAASARRPSATSPTASARHVRCATPAPA